jgi:hypothetical protein
MGAIFIPKNSKNLLLIKQVSRSFRSFFPSEFKTGGSDPRTGLKPGTGQRWWWV